MGERVVSARLQPIVRTGVGTARLRAMLSAVATTPATTAALACAQAAWEVCFMPSGECTKAIVSALENARPTSVLVQAYTHLGADREGPPRVLAAWV